MEKCEPEPPSILSHLPNGVSTSSKATEPTTSRDIEFGFRIADFGLEISDLRSSSLEPDTWYFVLSTTRLPASAHCLLPTAHCLLLTAFWNLRFYASERLQRIFGLLTKLALRMVVNEL